MKCQVCNEEYYLIQGHRCSNEVSWVRYANEAEEKIKLLTDLVLEIRSELVECAEGNFFYNWIKKVEEEIGVDKIREYAESK